MRKFTALVFAVFILFISPIAPFDILRSSVLAATTDYVLGDVPGAIGAALDPNTRDMNAPGHIWSVITALDARVPFDVFGHICGVTTDQCDKLSMDTMYKQSLAYYAESAMSYMYTNPPASTYAFIFDTGQSLGFIPKTAYAQGIGFSGLSPLLPLWKAFRNIAYLLLAIFMIAIGFLIMFRKKIDPKTVVTVQNALPSIVVTLLLITFSYAIVGVMIDLMYLLIMISISVLQPISNGVITQDTVSQFITGNYWTTFKYILSGGWNAFFNGLIPLFGPFKDITNNPVSAVESTALSIGILSAFVSGGIGAIVTGAVIAPALLFVLLALAFVIAVVRLLFVLISAYIQIIFALLISPFQLLLGAFPGSHAFENWIKNLIANLVVFPITAIMILIGSIIIKYNATEKLWGPPLLNPGGSSGMTAILGLGILFTIPSIAGSIKEALKAKPMVQAGPSAIMGPIGAAGGQVMNYAYQLSMIKHMIPQKEGKPAPSN